MGRSSSRDRSACWITTISRSRCPPTSRPSPFAAAACRTRSPFAMARTARAASWPKKPPRPLKKLRGPLSQRPTSALSVSPFAAHRPVDSLARWSSQCAAVIVAEGIVGRCATRRPAPRPATFGRRNIGGTARCGGNMRSDTSVCGATLGPATPVAQPQRRHAGCHAGSSWPNTRVKLVHHFDSRHRFITAPVKRGRLPAQPGGSARLWHVWRNERHHPSFRCNSSNHLCITHNPTPTP